VLTTSQVAAISGATISHDRAAESAEQAGDGGRYPERPFMKICGV